MTEPVISTSAVEHVRACVTETAEVVSELRKKYDAAILLACILAEANLQTRALLSIPRYKPAVLLNYWLAGMEGILAPLDKEPEVRSVTMDEPKGTLQ